MGAEGLARLVGEFMVLCLIFTLYQLASEFKYQSIAQDLPYDEASVLEEIADKLGLKGLSVGSSFCSKSSYDGIYCDCSFFDKTTNTSICHITRIELIANGLTGVIPQELANLTYLEFLNLRKNKLSGTIPDSLGNLSMLYYLDLSDNLLSGSIPESLGNMKFKPIYLFCMEHANETLSIKSVNVPQKYCGREPTNRYCYTEPDCKKIAVEAFLKLDLSRNQLNGSIPTTLGNVYEYQSGNESRGSIGGFTHPSEDWLLVSVNYSSYFLDLSNNHLTGHIPNSLGKLNFAYTYISLDNNFLKGLIPASLGELTYLVRLELDNNRISYTLPDALGNLTYLEYFNVESNRIHGPIPDSFANLTKLRKFSVAGNNLSGPLPDFIANWTSIGQLYLNGNNFHGKIPAGIFNLSLLHSLAISDVKQDTDFQFPPPTPTHLAERFPLHDLILRNCSITGKIPAYLGNMSSLSNIDLSFNSLTGTIPDSLRNLNLSYMSFSHNMLSGEIPDWIQNTSVLTKMDLSFNNFSKPTFENSSKLDRYLNLFSCCCNSSTTLPNTTNPTTEKYCPQGKPNYHSLFINCGAGERLNVDGNVYDQDNDTLQYYLSPKGNWARTSAGNTIYAFNSSELLKSVRCGLSSQSPIYDKARTSPVSLTYYGFCIRKGKYNVTLHFAEIVDEDKDYTSTGERVFDVYIQGERKLKDFNIIDKVGGPNKVYIANFTAVNVNDSTLKIHFYSAGKGRDQGPLISAISVTPEYKLHKQLSTLHIVLISVTSIIVFVLLLLLFAWMMGWLGNTDQLQEIDIGLEKPITLKQLKNATRSFSKTYEIGQGIFGTVYKAEVQGKTVAVKRLSSHSEDMINQLKNEFYNLKSLRQENLVQLLDVYNAKGLHLLIYEYMQNKSLAHALFDSKSKVKLNWEARFNICLGIARGLEYLHGRPGRKIVHRDIKSANILLDEKLKAKISDFGSASLYTEDNQFKFIKVEVTEGYMAPEYVQGVVTPKADVYSFGVVILETVSGRKNAGHKRDSQETEFLIDTACDLQRKGRLVDLVDKTLSTKYDAKQAIIILNLAVKCINISAKLRPSMSEVVSVLVGDKKIEEICSPALIDDINDPHVKKIAEFAVSEHNKKSGKKLELQSVVKGDTMDVAGYRLVIAVKDNLMVAEYESIVYERVWEHTKELLSFGRHIAQATAASSNPIKGEDETELVSKSTPPEISK